MKIQTKRLYSALIGVLSLLVFAPSINAANNLVPELTIDGVEKTFRASSSNYPLPNGRIEASSVEEVDGHLLTTAILTIVLPDDSESTIEFSEIVNETGIFDNGWTSSVGVSRTPEEPVLSLARVNEVDATYTSSGNYVMSFPSIPDSTLTISSDITVHSRLETVTVPAGTFNDTVRISITENHSKETLLGGTETSVIEIENWLANGVGIVKQTEVTTTTVAGVTTTETGTIELESYQIPGNLSTDAPTFSDGGTKLVLYDLDSLGIDSDGWYSGASSLSDGWRYFDWFKGFKPEGTNWIFHGRHGWLYVIADDTSGMFLWDVALGRWMFTTATTYPWMYAYGPNEGWVFFFEGGRPGSRYFKRGGSGEVISENELGL